MLCSGNGPIADGEYYWIVYDRHAAAAACKKERKIRRGTLPVYAFSSP
jgi:hypothetical protein